MRRTPSGNGVESESNTGCYRAQRGLANSKASVGNHSDQRKNRQYGDHHQCGFPEIFHAAQDTHAGVVVSLRRRCACTRMTTIGAEAHLRLSSAFASIAGLKTGSSTKIVRASIANSCRSNCGASTACLTIHVGCNVPDQLL